MSSSVFPGAEDNDTNLIRVLSTDTLIPAQHNNLNDAIQAVEGYLFPGVASGKGSLAIGSAALAVADLPVGANGDVLVADSTQTLGVKWAPGGGGGSLSPVRVVVAVDIPMPVSITFVDGPVAAALPAGTYMVWGTVLLGNTSGSPQDASARVMGGGVAGISAQAEVLTGNEVSLSVFDVVVLAATGSISIQGAMSGTGGVIKASGLQPPNPVDASALMYAQVS